MIDDPYKVLDIPSGASPEEIKKAYRKKAKEYHPDLHPNDPNAAQKMNEINEAYDMLQHPEKYKARREQDATRREDGGGPYKNTQNGGNRNYGGWTSDFGGFDFEDIFGFGSARFDTAPRPQAGDPPALAQAIRAVQERRFTDAVNILSAMTSSYRNDRWYYVSAAAYKGSGELSRAQDMIERAIQMNMGNQMYKQFRQEILQQARSETGAYNSGGNVSPYGFFWKLVAGMMIFRLVMGFLQLLLFGYPYGF